jgi:hypothetical protein
MVDDILTNEGKGEAINMQYLVQMKLVAQSRPTSPEAEITLVENYIFPSVEMFRKLRGEKRILADRSAERLASR